MTTKEIAVKTIERLPDSATWADIEERVRFIAAIEKGLQDIRNGRIIPHEEVKRSLGSWLGKLSDQKRLART